MADGAVSRARTARNTGDGKPVTLKDVARRAGVSPAAVSRAYQLDAPISDVLRAKVRHAADELGYRPNRLASGLAGGRSGLVGLVVGDMADPALLVMMNASVAALHDAGLGALVLTGGEGDTADSILSQARQNAVEGLIVLNNRVTRPFMRQLELSELPTFHAFEWHCAAPALPQAGVRDVLAARLAVMTLKERGYKRLGLIAGPEGARHHRDATGGFRTTADRHNMPAAILHAGGWSPEDGAAAAQQLVQTHNCDGIFCATDLLAVGALGALREAGKAIPDEIGLIGYDDAAFGSWPGVRLTTISFPAEAVAQACVARFAELRLDPDTPPTACIFEPELIERATLRPPNS